MGAEDTNGTRVVEALYALAADPGRWTELIEVLDQAPPALERSDHLSQLAYGATHVAQVAEEARAARASSAEGEVGVLIVSRQGRLIAANSSAAPYVARLGFSESPDGPMLTHLANFEVLSQARRRHRAAPETPVIVKFLEATGDGETFAYVVRARALPPALAATVASWSPEGGDEAAVLLPIVNRAEAFWTGIRRSFGLTAAEVRVTARLAEGLTLQEAASELGLSVNTLRNQLTSIFDKLAIRRQSELIRSLNQLAMLFDAVPASDGERPTRPPIFASEKDALFNAPPVRKMRLPDGRDLAWRSYGKEGGKAVMVCHGGLGASLMLPGTDALCRELGLWLLCPERPGIGQSDSRPDHSLTGVAEDLAAFIDQLGIARLQVCALTSGARFGVAAAAVMGARVSRTVLISPRLPADEGRNQPSRSPMVRFHDRIARNMWVIDSLFAVMRLRLTRALIERIARASAVSPGDAAYLQAHPALIDLMFEAMHESWRLGAGGAADETRCLRLDPGPSLEAIAGPIELWQGEEDAYASPQAAAAYFNVPPERLHVQPGIGNYMMHRQWGEVLRDLAQG